MHFLNTLRKKVRGGVYLGALLCTAALGHAQWELEESNTHAALRGIHSLGGGVAWASGTGGTVLRTEDGGYVWQGCAIPPGAEKLDFRGIQAFDEQTAIVMSSGPGDQSRLYKTTDGCRSWKLVFTNPDAPEGFFDALLMLDRQRGIVLGDPAPAELRNPLVPAGMFRVRITDNGGDRWMPITDFRSASNPGGGIYSVQSTPGHGLAARPKESFFAASNSNLVTYEGTLLIATSQARILATRLDRTSFMIPGCAGPVDPLSGACSHSWSDWQNAPAPLLNSSDSAGIFSLAAGSAGHLVAAGGDYKRPEVGVGSAAFSLDQGQHWSSPKTPPHGYRSAVAYDATHNLWITVGPNGTDISRDDGRNWTALKPAGTDPKDADQHWNALSPPFAVGPDGRIGKLRPSSLNFAKANPSPGKP